MRNGLGIIRAYILFTEQNLVYVSARFLLSPLSTQCRFIYYIHRSTLNLISFNTRYAAVITRRDRRYCGRASLHIAGPFIQSVVISRIRSTAYLCLERNGASSIWNGKSPIDQVENIFILYIFASSVIDLESFGKLWTTLLQAYLTRRCGDALQRWIQAARRGKWEKYFFPLFLPRRKMIRFRQHHRKTWETADTAVERHF